MTSASSTGLYPAVLSSGETTEGTQVRLKPSCAAVKTKKRPPSMRTSASFSATATHCSIPLMCRRYRKFRDTNGITPNAPGHAVCSLPCSAAPQTASKGRVDGDTPLPKPAILEATRPAALSKARGDSDAVKHFALYENFANVQNSRFLRLCLWWPFSAASSFLKLFWLRFLDSRVRCSSLLFFPRRCFVHFVTNMVIRKCKDALALHLVWWIEGGGFWGLGSWVQNSPRLPAEKHLEQADPDPVSFPLPTLPQIL